MRADEFEHILTTWSASTPGTPRPSVTAVPDAESVDSPDEAPADEAVEHYAVIVADPQTGEVDVHGPLSGPEALLDADRRRREYDEADLGDVIIEVARLHHPDGRGQAAA